MSTSKIFIASILALSAWGPSASAIDYFVSPTGGNVAPFASWANAATNIQDAIDTASAGDVVWVTNGVYTTGGKAMDGVLTNRVSLDKPLTVQSVNGPFVTTIQGSWDPTTTNGPLSVRCAWLTNGAVLKGFTLQKGATRNTGAFSAIRGGGAWCFAANASVANCIISTNAAFSSGCGVYSGTLFNCAICGNLGGTGAGAADSATLINCSVVSNSCSGASNARLTNCIAFYNNGANWSGGPVYYCCTTPTPVGPNIGAAPQLLPDGIHLSATSPCLAAGTNVTTGTDIDGELWANPPSIGCDQWHGLPIVTAPPKIAFTADPAGFKLTVAVGPEDPFISWWTRDGIALQDDAHLNGSQTTNIAVVAVRPTDAGAYQAVVSNAFGMVTSAVTQVGIHCADAAGTNPVPPYLDWATAATNIQDAIEAALSGEIVLVTNGIYLSGGKVMAGDLTNRVVLDKPLLVQSVNGPQLTTIQGAWDLATINGPLAVRCSWVTNGALLSGFTLLGGATRNSGDTLMLQSGGGAWGPSSNALVANCVIRGNSAAYSGGGAYQIGLLHCAVTGNSVPTPSSSVYGGGAERCNLTNCTISSNFCSGSAGGADMCYLRNCSVMKNSATGNGGGVFGGTLVNCTVAWNTVGNSSSVSQGGGVYTAKLTNCIVFGNQCLAPPFASTSNYYSLGGTFSYCCTAPLPTGAGNISAAPNLLSDGVHLAANSPCIGAGLATALVGTDIDGQSWANPPSIGCDEWLPAPILIGPPSSRLTGIPPALNLWGLAAGQPPFSYSWLKDGAILNDGPSYAWTQTSNLTVNSFGPTNSGGYQLIASNAFGMATSTVAQVTVHCANVAATAPAAPYTDWPSGATNLQDAVDAAGPGEFVLVTNGVYATGGRVMAGDLTNRIVVNKPLIVASINGPQSTIIQGAYDPATANGPLAVRCVWLGQGATLQALTLLGGATRNSGDLLALQSGGGAWCASTNELLLSCILSNNMAAYSGGGAYQGQLLRSVLWGNAAAYGGGAYRAFLANSLIRSNTASANGGGLHSTRFVNCTVTANYAPLSSGGGEWGSSGWNSIVYFNMAPGLINMSTANDWDLGSKINLVSCWTTTGSVANSTPSPQFVMDGIHLAATSPCRGTGNPLYAFGTDLDGEPWLNPPSIGCDEFYEADFRGPLSPGPISAFSIYGFGPPLSGVRAYAQTKLAGNADRVSWSFGDGVTLTNAFTFVPSHTWTNPGDYTVTFTAFNADNPAGVSTNAVIQVSLPDPPLVSNAAYTGTNFTFTFKAQGGISYIVEQTTNLVSPVTWQPVTSVFTYSDSTATVSDANATNMAGFYRVRTQ